MKILEDTRLSNTPETVDAALAGTRQALAIIDTGVGAIQAPIDNYLPKVVVRVEDTMVNSCAGRFLLTGIDELGKAPYWASKLRTVRPSDWEP